MAAVTSAGPPRLSRLFATLHAHGVLEVRLRRTGLPPRRKNPRLEAVSLAPHLIRAEVSALLGEGLREGPCDVHLPPGQGQFPHAHQHPGVAGVGLVGPEEQAARVVPPLAPFHVQRRQAQ